MKEFRLKRERKKRRFVLLSVELSDLRSDFGSQQLA